MQNLHKENAIKKLHLKTVTIASKMMSRLHFVTLANIALKSVLKLSLKSSFKPEIICKNRTTIFCNESGNDM